VATSVAAGLAGTATAGLSVSLRLALIRIVLARLALPVGGEHHVGRVETRVVLAVATRVSSGGIRYAESSFRHLSFHLEKIYVTGGSL
jgi:hypothetical protein